jgi:hypothetical protein
MQRTNKNNDATHRSASGATTQCTQEHSYSILSCPMCPFLSTPPPTLKKKSFDFKYADCQHIGPPNVSADGQVHLFQYNLCSLTEFKCREASRIVGKSRVATCRGNMSCRDVSGRVANCREESNRDVSGRHVASQNVGTRREVLESVGWRRVGATCRVAKCRVAVRIVGKRRVATCRVATCRGDMSRDEVSGRVANCREASGRDV